MESIVERMRRLKAGGSAPKPPAVEPEAPATEPEDTASPAVRETVNEFIENAELPEPPATEPEAPAETAPAPGGRNVGGTQDAAAPPPKGKVSLADLAAKAAASQEAQEPAQEPETETVSEPAAPPAAPEEPAQAPETPAKPRGRGRPAGSKNKVAPKKEQDTAFLLVEGAVVSRTVRSTVIDLIDLLHVVGEQMAQSMGTDSFYKIDTWVRRDAVKAMGKTVVEEHIPVGALVFATSLGDPEVANLFNAIAPHASTVLRKSA